LFTCLPLHFNFILYKREIFLLPIFFFLYFAAPNALKCEPFPPCKHMAEIVTLLSVFQFFFFPAATIYPPLLASYLAKMPPCPSGLGSVPRKAFLRVKIGRFPGPHFPISVGIPTILSELSPRLSAEEASTSPR